MSIQEYTAEPCPICGHTGWCGRREDGLILCKRPPSPPQMAGYLYKRMAKDGQTAMYVEAGREHRPPAAPPPPRRRPAPPRAASVREPHAASVEAFTPERRSALAAELGLPESILAELAIGWSDTAAHHANHDVAGAYVLPECDGQGRLIGFSYRFPSASVAGLTNAKGEPIGNKSCPGGGRRGLTVPAAWRDLPDPVLLVEGASDVLAGRTVGLNVVGRPSNSGGVEAVAQLLRHRRVIVLGENDRKADGSWPGKDGAQRTARHLESLWGRPVPVAFPPHGAKDLREWVRQLAGGCRPTRWRGCRRSRKPSRPASGGR